MTRYARAAGRHPIRIGRRPWRHVGGWQVEIGIPAREARDKRYPGSQPSLVAAAAACRRRRRSVPVAASMARVCTRTRTRTRTCESPRAAAMQQKAPRRPGRGVASPDRPLSRPSTPQRTQHGLSGRGPDRDRPRAGAGVLRRV
ncbi:hypothetical protein B2J93_5441 [Marssonina coronariae]|uniref:Uncharacterized protein n=1 Tax=Diplocarpon coronariae TaxID=2795749 RepID=A0A218YZC2_9HELO|nr:hypothetical protein B2J93_5441 [Marssonina coronariae]